MKVADKIEMLQEALSAIIKAVSEVNHALSYAGSDVRDTSYFSSDLERMQSKVSDHLSDAQRTLAELEKEEAKKRADAKRKARAEWRAE